jgi:hypothetical protein
MAALSGAGRIRVKTGQSLPFHIRILSASIESGLVSPFSVKAKNNSRAQLYVKLLIMNYFIIKTHK